MRFRTCLEHQTGGRGIVKSLAFAASHLQISKSIVTCVLPVRLGVRSGDVSFQWRHSQSIDQQQQKHSEKNSLQAKEGCNLSALSGRPAMILSLGSQGPLTVIRRANNGRMGGPTIVGGLLPFIAPWSSRAPLTLLLVAGQIRYAALIIE